MKCQKCTLKNNGTWYKLNLVLLEILFTNTLRNRKWGWVKCSVLAIVNLPHFPFPISLPEKKWSKYFMFAFHRMWKTFHSILILKIYHPK